MMAFHSRSVGLFGTTTASAGNSGTSQRNIAVAAAAPMNKATTKPSITTVTMASLFSALADPTRLRLINLIGNDEVCVCFLTDVLGTNQPKISRHLAYLRREGIVTARRQGQWMHYRLVTPSDPHAARLLAELRAWCAENTEMQRDRAQLLSKTCCL